MLDLLNHLWDVSCLGVVVVGPIPLSMRVAASAGDTDSWTHHLLVASIWWCTLQCSLGIALGAFGQLRLPQLLACESALVLIGLLAARSSPKTPRLSSLPIPSRRLVRSYWPWLCLGVLGITTSATMLATALTQPITEFDSLAYHLPQIARWYQDGSLVPLDNLRQIARYPFTWEVLELLFVLPLGEDFAIAFPNWFAWILLGLAVYRLARCLGAAPLAAVSAALLCASLPDVAFQVRTSMVDVAQAALFTCALYLLFEQRRARTGATCLAAIGIMLGIKASALLLACLLLVVWVVTRAIPVIESATRPDPDTARSARLDAGLLAGVIALVWLGGFWYARNWIQVGNPLGFVPVRVAGLELFPGDEFYADLGRTSIARLFDLRSSYDWELLGRAVYAKWGIPFFVLAALLAVLPWVVLRASSEHARKGILLMGLLSGVLILLYWSSPYTATGADAEVIGSRGSNITLWIANGLRYATPFLATFAVLGSLITTRTRKLIPILSLGAGIGCVQTLFLHASGNGVSFVVALGLLVPALWLLAQRVPILARKKTVLGLMATVVVLFATSLIARGQRDRQRDVAYRRVQFAIEKLVPPGAVVGYLMSMRSYPFYGRYLDRRVDFVPARERNQHEWIQYLQQRGIRVVAMGPMRKQFVNRKELEWLRAEESPFRRVFGRDPNLDSILFLVPE